MRLTLSKLIAKFLQWAEAALAPKTVSAYRYQLGNFLKSIGNRQVKRLRPLHLSGWGKTWHNYQAVNRLFNWAADEAGLLRANPFKSLRMPARNERKRILLPKEIARVLRGSRPSGRAFILALRESFARPQEIRAARWDELQSEDPETPVSVALAEGKALLVQYEYKDRRRRKESTRPRVILVSKRLGRMIARLRDRQPAGCERIFTNARGKPWTQNAVRLMMRRLRRRLQLQKDRFGENVVAYTFRHSCATLAAAKGVADRLLADILGHVETRTTRRYQHLQVSHLREALERLRSGT